MRGASPQTFPLEDPPEMMSDLTARILKMFAHLLPRRQRQAKEIVHLVHTCGDHLKLVNARKHGGGNTREASHEISRWYWLDN
jgi:hypothetical protein